MRLYPSLNLKMPEMFLKAVERERQSDVREMNRVQRLLAYPGYVDTVAVANVGAGEDDLITYDLPDGLLLADNQRIEIEGCFEFNGTGNNKQIRAYLGSTLLYDTGAHAHSGVDLVIKLVIIRTGISSQIGSAAVLGDTTHITTLANYFTASENLLTPKTFKFTGEAVADDDITQRYMTVKWFPAG